MRLALATAVLALSLAGPSTASALRPCPGQQGFSCGTLTVPLDRGAPAGATLALRYAVQSGRAAARRPLLVALSGGPGQPGVAFATGFAESLRPLLSRYRLAVLDQRGTGGSGVLRCPGLQRLGALHAVGAGEAAACAALLGPRRAFYATRDTVDDLEALRVALGGGRMALMGVSYGTFVAQQYARVHPDTTAALVLDSVVGADGVDPFLLDSYAATPRVLREQCAQGRCDGITADPVADAGAIAAQAAAGALRGRVYDTRGRARTTRYGGADEIVNLLVAGDLNPFLQAALPGALAGAVRGDPALLLRLRRIADGPRTPFGDFSAALNAATGCADTALPYALTSPPAVRDAAVAGALEALDPASFAPFDRATVLRTSYVEECRAWPADVVRAPSADPLPDVPALLLTGRLDLRTPMENAVAVAAELPRATIVRVPGSGHDELDSDITGCTRTALSRFARGRTVGTPCRGKSDQVTVLPPAPRSLADLRRAPGVPGDRGRALFAALDTVSDARVTLLQCLFAGLDTRAGGLHGGWLSAPASLASLRLRRYSYLRGLRVSGRLRLTDAGVSGRVSVTGATRALRGTLRLFADGRVRGRLGGRAVAYGGRARAARAGGVPPLTRAARGLRLTRALASRARE